MSELQHQFASQQFSNDYELVNGVAMHAENPDNFHVPPEVIKRHVRPGQFVELRIDSPRFSVHEDVFCYPRDGSSQEKRDGVLHIDGISVYLSRLAPLAVLGSSEKTKFKRGGGYGFLAANTVDSMPHRNWQDFVQDIRTKVNDFGFKFLDRETALQPLPFEADIPTILAEPPFKFFDAVFYWED